MHVAALCRLLPERDPHPAIYGTLEAILDRSAGVASCQAATRSMRRRDDWRTVGTVGVALIAARSASMAALSRRNSDSLMSPHL